MEETIKALEKALAVSHQLVDTLLETINDAVTIVDADGVVTNWNHAAEVLYGISAQEIVGKRIADFEWKSLMLARLLQRRESVRQAYHEPRPGIHVLVNTLPVVHDEKIVGVISSEQDVTKLVRLGHELFSTTARLHHLETKVTSDSPPEDPFQKLKGQGPVISNAIQVARRVAATDATVLITGESGVGKELFAHAIHRASPRAKHKFVAINCGAIPSALFESELFGYEAGAFTGASRSGLIGKLELAHQGTLFLDEVGELPLDLQVKLLRVLQEKKFYRVGGTVPIEVDVRIVAATNRNLETRILEGKFRDDLYYRLNVVTLEIPPLRERLEDIPELIQLFTQEFCAQYGKSIPYFDPDVIMSLMNHSWPGNIRQLRNVIERLLILAETDNIRRTHLPASFQTPKMEENHALTPTLRLSGREGAELDKINSALQTTYGNRSAAAKLLGVSRGTLYNKMKKYGLLGEHD